MHGGIAGGTNHTGTEKRREEKKDEPQRHREDKKGKVNHSNKRDALKKLRIRI